MCLLSFVNVLSILVTPSLVTFDNAEVRLINAALTLNANNKSRAYNPLLCCAIANKANENVVIVWSACSCSCLILIVQLTLAYSCRHCPKPLFACAVPQLLLPLKYESRDIPYSIILFFLLLTLRVRNGMRFLSLLL